jgi:uncharacterized protein GlcG (DUF336 family)
MHVNLQNAEKAIEGARKKAIALKTQMCIAVVDSGANLKAFMRMDDAWVGSIDIAIKKGEDRGVLRHGDPGARQAVAAGRAALRHRTLE